MRRTTQGYQGFRDQRPLVGLLLRLVSFLLILFFAYQAVTRIVVQSAVQQSEAMLPTLEPGDRALLLPLIYGPRLPLFSAALPGFKSPEHGDLVLVRPSSSAEATVGVRLAEPVVRFGTLQQATLERSSAGELPRRIKRVIGLPGDTIRIERFTAFVRRAGETEFQNEFTLSSESYQVLDTPRPGAWAANDPFGASVAEIELQENEFFVLSDNRSHGIDSRHWGPVTREALLGRVVLRYWPFDRFGSL